MRKVKIATVGVFDLKEYSEHFLEIIRQNEKNFSKQTKDKKPTTYFKK